MLEINWSFPFFSSVLPINSRSNYSSKPLTFTTYIQSQNGIKEKILAFGLLNHMWYKSNITSFLKICINHLENSIKSQFSTWYIASTWVPTEIQPENWLANDCGCRIPESMKESGWRLGCVWHLKSVAKNFSSFNFPNNHKRFWEGRN